MSNTRSCATAAREWASRAIALDPPKGGEVIEKMICWRDTPEYYTTVRRDYDTLVGGSSLERDVEKSGITKIRVFDFFTEITGRRGPGPKLAESRYFVAECYNTKDEQFAFHRALRSEEFGLQFRGNAINMSEFEEGLKMVPGRSRAHPARHRPQRDLRGGFPAHRAVQPHAVGGEASIRRATSINSTFDVRTNVVQAPEWWAKAAE